MRIRTEYITTTRRLFRNSECRNCVTKETDLRFSFMSHLLACGDKSCTRLKDLLDRFFFGGQSSSLAIRQMSRQNQPSVNPFCILDRNRSSAIIYLTTSLRDATTSFWEPLLRLDCLRRRLDRVAVWHTVFSQLNAGPRLNAGLV